MPCSRPGQRLRDIVENIDRIMSYVEGMSLDACLADGKTADAVERCLQRIGEAAVKPGHEAERLAPRQPWAQIRGIGDWLRHGYDQISPDRVWTTVTVDPKPLREACVLASTGLER